MRIFRRISSHFNIEFMPLKISNLKKLHFQLLTREKNQIYNFSFIAYLIQKSYLDSLAKANRWFSYPNSVKETPSRKNFIFLIEGKRIFNLKNTSIFATRSSLMNKLFLWHFSCFSQVGRSNFFESK